MSMPTCSLGPPPPSFIEPGCGHVHLLGISGIGMSGLAFLLRARGWRVSGCDLSLGRPAHWLMRQGIPVFEGHDPAHISPDVDVIIRSSAVPRDGAELQMALATGRPVVDRGAVLAELLAAYTSVTVSGTHGKTTTTGFIAQLLESCGRHPGWCIGGEVDVLGGIAGVGTGDVLVVEADESDGTVALYHPDIAVVTNIEFDHMEHFENEAALEGCFRRLVENARRAVVYCADDPRAAAVCGASPRAVSYGFGPGAQVHATDLDEAGERIRFDAVVHGTPWGRIDLPAPGRHNALNALAALAVVHALGLGPAEARAACARLALPRRRFDTVAAGHGVRVISDYSHHPSEVAALVRVAMQLNARRLLSVFQPHRYTRTRALGPAFPPAFDGVDDLVLVPVYAASEPPLPGGRAWDLYTHFRARADAADRAPRLASSLAQAWEYIRSIWREGDVLLVIGAGDVEKIGSWAREALAATGTFPAGDAGALPGDLGPSTLVRQREPLANKTTWRVGGDADIWMELGTVADLKRAAAWAAETGVPFRVIGAGSNILVSDLGLRGVTARLRGPDFMGLRLEADAVITAGAGVPLARLLNDLEAQGLAGLEFLEGIPGTLGGALRMNAGAWGKQLSSRVQWIRCLNRDGTECIVRELDLDAGYRRCGALDARIAIEAGLKLDRGHPDEIRTRRSEVAQRRAWFAGLRCAGSVFRNPEGDAAGRLIEQAGLKGRSVGGACVCEAHANVMATRDGACASDVRALIEIVRTEVEARFGVRLATEVVVLE